MPDRKLAPEKIGSLIGAGFGVVFVLANTGSLPGALAAVLRGLAVLALVAVLVAVWRVEPAPPAGVGGFNRGYWLVVAAEAVALFGGLAVINTVLDAPQAAIAWVALVVGTHFAALAMVWRLALFHVLGWAISVCGAAGLALAAAGADVWSIDVLSGVTPGALLLAFALWGSTRARFART